jgi:uncharacterized protein YjiS (DUF1127 family)
MSLNDAIIAPCGDRFHLLGTLAGLKLRFARMRARNRARAELHAMNDHELADIGVARTEIDRVVETGRPVRR